VLGHGLLVDTDVTLSLIHHLQCSVLVFGSKVTSSTCDAGICVSFNVPVDSLECIHEMVDLLVNGGFEKKNSEKVRVVL
jgi:hypothetical protein